jgi:hypothetical protein
MSEQIPNSQMPPLADVNGNVQIPGTITPEQLEEMKARARELAIRQTLVQQQAQEAVPPSVPPQVIYVRRNLTVAELLLLLLLSCGIVLGVQTIGGVVANTLPRIEIKLK